MKYLVTAEEMRRYDTNTIERIGIPAEVLMERAALAAMDAVTRRCGEHLSAPGRGQAQTGGTALILAGMGNNGGDGLALARLLRERRFSVEVWCVGDSGRASGQWRRQREILESYDVDFVTEPGCGEYTVIIDALFGVGLSREISGIYAEAVERINALSGYGIALDLPSGVDSDTGKLWGCAFRADETVTFGFCKKGLVLYPGCEYAGKVTVADIGITDRSFFDAPPKFFAWDEEPRELLPRRRQDGNKGTFGKVLLVAGSLNMAGAAVLSAKAAYRAGAGMVKVVTPPENRIILQMAVPEVLFGTADELEKDLEWADVIAIGPGLGKGAQAAECLERVITQSGKPLLIDADGLNLLAERPALAELLKRKGDSGRGIVLTPHVGELARLTGEPVHALKERLPEYGRVIAGKFRAVAAAKDARTFICGQDGPVCVNVSGNNGMATAGSGDVLAGIIAGLLAQGMEPFPAASVGAYLHGLAGDRASARRGEHSCMAGDIVEELSGITTGGPRDDRV